MSDRRISLAIPIYNEVKVLPELLRRVRATLDGIPGGPHEAILVDDGSADGSAEVMDREAASDPRIVAVHLSRNFGHQAALSAALDHVTGDAVVLMDGDLQDPPEEVPRFLEKHDEGYDVVYAVRRDRKESWILRACYFVFYRIIALLSDTRLPLDSGDFALLSRRVVDQLRNAPEHNRYLRGLRAWVGFRQVGIPVERSERFAGSTKYSTWRLVKLALDGIFAFSVVPLRLAALLGVAGMGGALCYALYALYARLVLDESPQGFTALIIMVVFLSSVQLLFLGVVGEYLGRVYEEVKRRPHYVVGEVVRSGIADPSDD